MPPPGMFSRLLGWQDVERVSAAFVSSYDLGVDQTNDVKSTAGSADGRRVLTLGAPTGIGTTLSG